MIQAREMLRERALYCWLLAALPAIAIFGHALAPGVAVVKGQDLGIALAFVILALAVLAWIPYRAPGSVPLAVRIVLLLLLAAWAWQLTRTQLDQSLFNLSAFVVPVAAALIWTKRAGLEDVRIALLVLAYALLLVNVVSLVIGSLGWMPDGFEIGDGGGINRFGLLLDWLGVPGRWAGPAGSVNLTAPIGGLLIVLGFTMRSWNRGLLLVGGAFILVLSQGRTAIVAVIGGVLVLVLWSPATRRLTRPTLMRAVVTVLALVGFGVYVLLLDPTLNGRTPLWADFVSLLPAQPWLGVGDSGVAAYMDAQAGLVHSHAHSVIIDATVRWGIPLGVLTLAIYLAAARPAWRARMQNPTALALVVFVVLAGLAETLHAWAYWSVYSTVLVLATMLASAPAAAADGGQGIAASVSLPRE